MAQVAATGVSWIRVDIFMSNIEPQPGVYDWSSDSLVDRAAAAGLAVDLVIGLPSPWAENAGGLPDPAAFGDFVHAVAAHYESEGVRTFEIWNEPNMGPNWKDGVVPIATYVAVLRASYQAIKSVAPDSVVMVGGLSPAADGPDNQTVSPQTFLRTLYQDGAKGYFDALADHPYSYPDLPVQRDAWNPWVYLPGLHEIMAANGDGDKRIWFTEYGAPTSGARSVSADRQALSITEAFTLARRWTWAGPLLVFDWIDNGADGPFGLHRPNGEPKAALSALIAAARSDTTG
jgi:hypothetical protein